MLVEEGTQLVSGQVGNGRPCLRTRRLDLYEKGNKATQEPVSLRAPDLGAAHVLLPADSICEIPQFFLPLGLAALEDDTMPKFGHVRAFPSAEES